MVEFMQTIAVLGMVMIARTHLCFRIRMKAMQLAHEENLRRLGTEADLLEFPIVREIRGTGPSYSAMVFDIRRWTLRQFYPDIAELAKR